MRCKIYCHPCFVGLCKSCHRRRGKKKQGDGAYRDKDPILRCDYPHTPQRLVPM